MRGMVQGDEEPLLRAPFREHPPPSPIPKQNALRDILWANLYKEDCKFGGEEQ